MSDILCAVCSEPWDAYGVHHGDMMAWEAKLFKAGAGCPSCAGAPPEGQTLEQREAASVASAESMFSGWDDPHSFEHVNDTMASAIGAPMPKRLEWKEPDRKVEWQCAGCKAKAVHPHRYSLSEPNTGDSAELEFIGGDRVHYSHGFAFARGDATFDRDYDASNKLEVAGKPYCDKCAGMCEAPDCTTVVFLRQDLDPGDPYRPGASFMSTGNLAGCSYGDTLCVECFERESNDEGDDESED